MDNFFESIVNKFIYVAFLRIFLLFCVFLHHLYQESLFVGSDNSNAYEHLQLENYDVSRKRNMV